MKRRVMRQEDVAEFCRYLQGEERSQGTIETYRREIRAFAATLPENRVVTKEVVVAWKETLAKRYAVSTVNGKLAALNGLFSFLGWRECRVKPLRRQRELFRDKGRELDKGEYLRLLAAAKRRENWRLYYLMETLASTGMRVSELRFVTVQALAAGRVRVDCKGKHRTIFLTAKLCRALGNYCRRQKRTSGPVFVTRTGRPVDRSNIWREMRALSTQAGVGERKVFPHNFRHQYVKPATKTFLLFRGFITVIGKPAHCQKPNRQRGQSPKGPSPYDGLLPYHFITSPMRNLRP